MINVKWDFNIPKIVLILRLSQVAEICRIYIPFKFLFNFSFANISYFSVTSVTTHQARIIQCRIHAALESQMVVPFNPLTAGVAYIRVFIFY